MTQCASVFISSTFTDLKQARQYVREAVLQCDCLPLGMEYFPATEGAQFEYIKKEIDMSDCVVLILANNYGTVAPEGKSYTEKEFDYAAGQQKPILAFISDEMVTDERLNSFRQKVMNRRLVKFWKTEQELKGYVIQGLMNWKYGQDFACHNGMTEIVGWKSAEYVEKEVRLDTAVNVRLEELIDYIGDGSDWAPNYYYRRMTFWEIYAVLSPYLLTPKDDNEVNEYLSNFIRENSDDIMGYGDEKVVSSDLMRIKLVLLAHHLIAINSQGRWILLSSI